LKVLLASSSEVSIDVLNFLQTQKGVQLKCVVTNPDKATGRGQSVTQNQVAQWCEENEVEVKKVESNGEFLEIVKNFGIELVITVAYGHILKDPLLSAPKHGCINLHYSLLPRYRGAAPVQWAILDGEDKTGVTVFKLDSGMDTGPIYLKEELEIQSHERTDQLIKRLNLVGVGLISKTLNLIEEGVQPEPQPSDGATLAPKFRKEDGAIDWSQEANQIYNKFRAISENPGVYTNYLGSKIKLNEIRTLESKTLPIGNFGLMNGELLVGTKDLDILINRLTPEGRKQMSGKDFINGLTTKENLNFA
jgi:methionyl-tRNA formyltransferase